MFAVAARGRSGRRRAGPVWSSSCAARWPPSAASPVAEAAPLWQHAHDAVTADYHGVPRYCTGFLVEGLRAAGSSSSSSSHRSAIASSSSPTASSRRPRTLPHGRSRAPRWSAATALGALSGVEISDMYAQRDALAERAACAPTSKLEDDGRLADVLRDRLGGRQPGALRQPGARRLLLTGRPTADELLDAIRTSPAGRHRPCCRMNPGLQVVPSTPHRPRRCRLHVVPNAWARTGPGRARRLSHRPARLGAGRPAFAAAAAWAGTAEVPGGRQRRRRTARGRRPARSRPGSTLRHGAGWRDRRAGGPGRPFATLVEHRAIRASKLELHAGGQAHPRYSVSAE